MTLKNMIIDMDKEDLLKRGEEIFAELEIIADDHSDKSEKRQWACSVVHSVIGGFDTPLKKKDVCMALAKAELLGKKVTIEPDSKFTGDADGTIMEQYDGWTYHIVIS